MKKILVPCDFSQTSIEAIKFATDIALRKKGEIQIVHAIDLRERSYAVPPAYRYKAETRSLRKKEYAPELHH